MDTVWSVEMTRRLKDRLEQRGRAPEVHFYDDGPHGLNSEDENRQHERLIDFFARHLA
jgi:dipeptidyl aminopeptidase/acylaminoacyl peptidase